MTSDLAPSFQKEARRCLSRHVGTYRVAWQPKAISSRASARSVVTGSYGKIVSTCDGKSQLGSSPARSMQDGKSLCCARLASAIKFLRRRLLPGDVSHRTNYFPIHLEEVPLWSELFWLFYCLCCLLKTAKLALTRRLPTALSFLGIPQWSIPRGGVRRYKPMLQFALPRLCPDPHVRVKVPNRGVDWSSRPRRACYPWGNFSVTSSPQQ